MAEFFQSLGNAIMDNLMVPVIVVIAGGLIALFQPKINKIVQKHLTAGNAVHPAQGVEQGGFSCAASADDGDKFACADAEGNIWAGGQLHIVDGNSLSVMKRLPASPSSVLSNSIRCMYIDNDGTVWIGHDTGISYYNSRFDMFRFLPTDDGTGNSYVFSLCEDGDGVWIGGINSIRKYSFDGKLGQSCTLDSPGNGYNIIQAMEKDRKGNIWAASHKDMLWKYGYDGKVSSAVMEAEAVDRWLALAEQAGYPVNVVHLSTQRGLEAARAARNRGQKVYLESCPQYFTLTEDKYHLPGFESAKYVCAPPARPQSDVDALWEALENGEIDTIGTDHCSFNFHPTKELGKDDFSAIPGGIPGTEHRPPIMYTYGVKSGRITSHQMMLALAQHPAQLFGMFPQKGALAVGSDADIVIFDPDYTWRITAEAQYQRVDYTPYEGMEMAGRTDTVLLDGQVAVRDGKVVQEGLGRYVSRGPSQFWR